jgi:hypothetical protein
MRHVRGTSRRGAVIASALAASMVLGTPVYTSSAAAPNDGCRPGFVLGPTGLVCVPDPSGAQAAPEQPAQPAPRRSALDRLLGRNRPAPAQPIAPVQPAPPPPPAPAPAQPAPAPQPAPPPIVPVVILPAPVIPGPGPADRVIWLHTCVDLYAANTHLLQLDNQVVDVPDLAYVLFQCSTNPTAIPVIPVTPVVPGQPPSAGSQTVVTHLPVTG